MFLGNVNGQADKNLIIPLVALKVSEGSRHNGSMFPSTVRDRPL